MKKLILLFGLFLLLGSANSSLAYDVQPLDNTPVANDFVLGPGKTDLVLDPGQETTQQITVTNRLGVTKNFKVEVEDFAGSYDSDETVKLFGDVKGPYSLKDYVKPEVTEFSLKQGERITLPVKITIPKDSQPGGLYASVLVSTVPSAEEAAANKGQTKVISRLGTLFFVRVSGTVNESGHLQSFKLSEKNAVPEKGPISFEIGFNNDGNVHLTPSGKIEIKNLLGKTVGMVDVDKYFAMPNSLRTRVVTWETGSLFGKYTAVLTLNTNYQQKPSQAETLTLSFWVIPWKMVLLYLIVLIALLVVLKLALSKFKFEFKKK